MGFGEILRALQRLRDICACAAMDRDWAGGAESADDCEENRGDKNNSDGEADDCEDDAVKDVLELVSKLNIHCEDAHVSDVSASGDLQLDEALCRGAAGCSKIKCAVDLCRRIVLEDSSAKIVIFRHEKQPKTYILIGH